MTDFETWFLDHNDRIVKFQIYRRMFTPLEQDRKWIDASEFTEIYYTEGLIKEAIELPDGDILLGITELIDFDVSDMITYYKLSEIRLSRYPDDSLMKREEEE